MLYYNAGTTDKNNDRGVIKPYALFIFVVGTFL